MLDEIEKGDLLDQINLFESKVIKFSEKAKSLLERVKNFETHSDQLEDIFEKFGKITSQFENGHYKKMIVGKLETNYDQINEMSAKLDHENTQNGEIKERIKQFENGETGKNMKAFDEIRNAIDDRQALIQDFENNLANQKTMIAEYNHIDIEEHIIDFF